MKLRTRLKDESGQAMLLTLLCMTCLLGFVGFAADVGTLFYAKRNLQIAADSAAIAGAAELNYGDVTAAAQAAAAQNGVTIGVNGGAVTINLMPLSGAYAGQAGYVEAIVSQIEPTFFMKMFNFASMTVSARAVATLGSGNNCIFTLGTSGTGISITGNASVSAPKCGIIDDSSSPSALALNGNAATLVAQSIGVVGGISGPTGNITPTPITGIAPSGDPLAYLPTPTVPSSCSTPNFTSTVTLTPGCYTGLSGNGNIILSPGLYIINGDINLTGNASLTGMGVTLDLLGNTSLGGNVTLDLTAPTTGTYANILIYQPSTNSDALSLIGTSGTTLNGIVYAPSAAVSLQGTSGSNIAADFVVNSLTLSGNAVFKNYVAIGGNNNFPLTSARLVE